MALVRPIPRPFRFPDMGHAITVRLSEELAAWLEEVAARTGVSQGKIVRDLLARARAGGPHRSFMHLAGSVRGPRNLSSRMGFSRVKRASSRP